MLCMTFGVTQNEDDRFSLLSLFYQFFDNAIVSFNKLFYFHVRHFRTFVKRSKFPISLTYFIKWYKYVSFAVKPAYLLKSDKF